MATHKTNLPARYEEKEESLGSFLWQITKLFTKCTWYGSKFVVKNAPAAIGMAWEIKKEITKEIAQGLHEAKQTYKEMLIEQEIAKLAEQATSRKIGINSIGTPKSVLTQELQLEIMQRARQSINEANERKAYDARLEKFRNL